MTYENYEVYTVKEYAQKKGKSAHTIRRWIQNNIVKSLRVGKGKKRARFYVLEPRNSNI